MAKKKKNKVQADKGNAGGPTTSAAAPAIDAERAQPKSGAGPAIERAFQVGNFSAVRKLATPEVGAEGARILSLVKVDRAQLLVGLGAMAVMIIVALWVLRLG